MEESKDKGPFEVSGLNIKKEQLKWLDTCVFSLVTFICDGAGSKQVKLISFFFYSWGFSREVIEMERMSMSSRV